MPPAHASNRCSQQTRPAPKWAAPIPPLPKSHNHCAEPLVLLTNGQLTVHARIDATEEISVSLALVPLAECPDLSSAVLRYAIRTKEVLLLSDAATVGIFTGDPVCTAT